MIPLLDNRQCQDVLAESAAGEASSGTSIWSDKTSKIRTVEVNIDEIGQLINDLKPADGERFLRFLRNQ